MMTHAVAFDFLLGYPISLIISMISTSLEMRSLYFLVVLAIFSTTQSALISFVRLREPDRNQYDSRRFQIGLPMLSLVRYPIVWPRPLTPWPKTSLPSKVKVKKTIQSNGFFAKAGRPLCLYKREYRTSEI